MATVKLDPAKGVQIPNKTTTERNAISSPETGALIWNTTTSAVNQYNGSAWGTVGISEDTTKLPLAGGALTGAVTTNSTFDGRDVAADGVLATNALPKAGGTLTGATNLTINQAANTQFSIVNNTGSTAGHSSLKVQTGGAQSGDPFIHLNNEVRHISIGIDNSDSDKFKISDNATLGTNDRFVINSSGNVGIGQSSPSSGLSLPTFIHIGNSSTTQSGIILEDDEQKWEIAHNGDIAFRYNTTPYFRVGSTLTQVPTTDFQIGAGDLIFGTAGKGVVLGATSNTDANTLDDYEEGTWNPAFTGHQGSIGATDVGEWEAYYTKIGRLVSVQFKITLTNKGSWSGEVRLTGLPFSVAYTLPCAGPCQTSNVNFAGGSVGDISMYLTAGVTYFRPRYAHDNSTPTMVLVSECSNTTAFAGTLSYVTTQ
jgi:hypothetical protein